MSENNAKTINNQFNQIKKLLNSGLSDKLTEDRDNFDLIRHKILKESENKINCLMNCHKEGGR